MIKDTLKTLLSAYGATGREENIAGVIREMIAPYVDETRIDALGNLIALRHGAGKKLMFAAHMDHIGFIVTDIDEHGFLRVFNVGGISKLNSINRHVVFANGVSGVLGNEVENAKDHMTDITTMFIDIGAKDKADAEKHVRIGDVAVYAPDFFELGDDMIAGPAMDNRVGCCVLIEMLRSLKERSNEITAVFTTQEEVGLRGAKAAAYNADPDMGIALDVTLSGDTPKGSKIAVKTGDGPCVKIMDSSLICSPEVVRVMEEAADAAGVKYQREVLTAGGTDASAIQLTRGGVAAGVLSIACRYVHSACEAVSISDIEGGVKLLAAVADKPQNKINIQTERIMLREMNSGDFQALCAIMEDPDVMYAYEKPFTDAEVQGWLGRQLERYRKYGFGLFAVVLKETGEMIGQCGLTLQPWRDQTLLEVGYLFNKAYWHKGYAIEAAAACRDYAFNVLGADKVCSIIRDTNTASQNVAKRNGMQIIDKWVKHFRGVDMPHVLYSVSKDK